MPLSALFAESEMRTESRQSSRFAGKRVHFIGIGGCGMSGLARMLLDAGAIVTGSDVKPSAATIELARRGATVFLEQTAQNLTPELDLVVRTAAISEMNPEYMAARGLGIPQLKYAQLLGKVMAERHGIAVSGTHGKSTTTSMIAFALLECGADPSFVIGGTVGQLGGSSRSGQGEAFVVEACEFDRSFHNYCPRIAIITNIEADHLDCYSGGLPEIIESFRTFANRVPADGRIIANGQDANVRQALVGFGKWIDWVGLEDEPTQTWSTRLKSIEGGCYRGDVFYKGLRVAELKLGLPGRHNLFNATVAIAACHTCGVSPQAAADAIFRFEGVDRRMSELGMCNGAIVVDDYGHHPTEIQTTLRAMREKYSPNRLIAVFQPHQHSRTRFLMDDFAKSFDDAELVILPDIYASRDTEADKRSVASSQLAQRLLDNGHAAMHMPEFPQVIAHLRREARAGDLIVTMGAGNVCDIGWALVGKRD